MCIPLRARIDFGIFWPISICDHSCYQRSLTPIQAHSLPSWLRPGWVLPHARTAVRTDATDTKGVPEQPAGFGPAIQWIGRGLPQRHGLVVGSFLPSGELTKSNWKWPFIVDSPIKIGDFPLLFQFTKGYLVFVVHFIHPEKWWSSSMGRIIYIYPIYELWKNIKIMFETTKQYWYSISYRKVPPNRPSPSGHLSCWIFTVHQCMLFTRIPSGKHTKNYGKSPFWWEQINYTWPFSIAMFWV